MGVIGDERRLEQFIHVGMDPEVSTQIDHLPEGKGLLGALIDDPHPVRLETIGSDARSSGFPTHHPPMESFLGVPIRVRDEVYGNLYLTDSVNGAFSCRRRRARRRRWPRLPASPSRTPGSSTTRPIARGGRSALAETARRLVQDDDEDQLGVIVKEVQELADADLVSIALISEGR